MTKEKVTENIVHRPELKVLHQQTNKKGEVQIVERGNLPDVESPFGNYALVSTSCFDDMNKLTKTELVINSTHILEALREIIKFYPGQPLDFRSKLLVEDPYEVLYHHRAQLAEYRDAHSDPTVKVHINLLLEFLLKEGGQDYLARVEKLLGAGLITFGLLWSIFKPGDLMYTTLQGHERLLRLEKTTYDKHVTKGPYFQVSCTFWSYDGKHLGTARESFRIWEKQEFIGKIPSKILSLSIRPVSFGSGKDEMYENLRKRGSGYLGISERCVKQYSGLMLYLRGPPVDYYNEQAEYSGTWLPDTTTGRVMIDPKTFNEEEAAQREEWDLESGGNSMQIDDQWGEIKEGFELNGKALSDKAILTLPPYVYGYSLAKKAWCKFFVDCLSSPAWKPDAFKDLMLPKAQKDILRGLAISHRFPETGARDLMTLKGKGLIILLHGAPGCGKTLTAEMTAELTNRALLTISAGELGEYAQKIEAKLEELLTYATIFKAIVLIDEADVFLEARSSEDNTQLARTALVAVFLRHLEYFQGIIFLTSNRISVFDPAIKSRIHLALQYRSPGKDVRKMLWKSRLLSVPAIEIDDTIDVDEMAQRLSTVKMNGREISNTVTTACTLARSQGTKLALKELKICIGVWEDFNVALNVPDHNSEEIAGTDSGMDE